MRFPIWRLFVRVIAGFIACGWAVSRTDAHEPFDLSSRITLYSDRLELVSTLGNDAMRQLLAGTGLTEDEIATRLKSHGPEAGVEEPVAVARRFFELTNGGAPLNAKSARSLSEGMEISLTIIYPRPVPGKLEIKAVCYETIPDLSNGIVIVHDESVGPLGAAMFSPSRLQMTVSIAAPTTTSISLPTPTPAPVAAPGSHSGAISSPPTKVSAPEQRPSFGAFFCLGVEHIWSGIDHLLFLAALLIGVRRGRSILGIITCFTLAHSVTLALAALQIVNVPSRVIEPLIAASIIVVCIVNFIRPGAESDRVWMAGAFGLIHGFGFATALKATGLGESGASIALPLFSFNLGVETGQLIVAGVFLPSLVVVRQWPGFVRYGAPALSAGVLLISGYWLLERTIF